MAADKIQVVLVLTNRPLSHCGLPACTLEFGANLKKGFHIPSEQGSFPTTKTTKPFPALTKQTHERRTRVQVSGVVIGCFFIALYTSGGP